MKRIYSVFWTAAISLTASSVLAQNDGPVQPPQNPPGNAQQASPCPRVQIQNPQARVVREGQPISFVANISGGDQTVSPSIVWNVSAGVITDGQGTRRITVDSSGAGRDRNIVAELWLGGYAAECAVQVPGQTVNVVPPAYKADEFGELSAEDETKRLEAAIASLTQPTDSVYVIAYSGRTGARGYTYNALKRIKTQAAALGQANQRIGALDGGFREQPSFEVWIVPDGAELPRPSPTIDRKEIVYPPTPRKTAPRKP